MQLCKAPKISDIPSCKKPTGIKKAVKNLLPNRLILGWSRLGSNQGPSDYESDALTS
ncbi:MAG: hypothetical protein JWO03_3201 [Bacteroidetes bacterium]|nr:hypothetical protein [Bacteroidota bacterium]